MERDSIESISFFSFIEIIFIRQSTAIYSGKSRVYLTRKKKENDFKCVRVRHPICRRRSGFGPSKCNFLRVTMVFSTKLPSSGLNPQGQTGRGIHLFVLGKGGGEEYVNITDGFPTELSHIEKDSFRIQCWKIELLQRQWSNKGYFTHCIHLER